MSSKVGYTTPNFTGLDYTKFFAAGAICCAATHAVLTPLDVAKTRIQIDPEFTKFNLLSAGRAVVSKEGPKGLMTGFGPTAVGYCLQGGAKFAGYEFWKLQLVDAVGGPEAATSHRTAIYLISATIAEFFADILLTPLEATRIRMVSDRSYAKSLPDGLTRMAKEGGLAELYAGFIPIIAKQIPYAVGQFTAFEWMTTLVYAQMGDARANISKMQQTGVTLGCGIVAGLVAAVLSNPADVLLSKINKEKRSPGASVANRLKTLAVESGPRGLFIGLGPRLVMTSFLVAGQFLMYSGIKDFLGARKGIEISH